MSKHNNNKHNKKHSPFDNTDIAANTFGKSEIHHPDALTVEEILTEDKNEVASNSALDSLLKRMTENTKADTEKADETSNEPIVLNNENQTIAKNEEKEGNTEDSVTPITPKDESKPFKEKSSLLNKLMPYIIDENGKDTSVNNEPLYKLESVAEILRVDSERTLEKLSKEYGISFDKPKKDDPETIDDEPVKEAKTNTPITETFEEETEPEEEPVIQVISDIDIPNTPFYKIDTPEENPSSTITFTPVTDNEDNKQKIVVSTHTKPIDFTGELLKVTDNETPKTDEVTLEKSEFEEYVPKEEFTSAENGKKLLKKFASTKKHAFFVMWGSILLTLCISFFKFPFMSNLILSHTKVCMIIASCITFLSVILNCKIFRSFTKMFSKNSDSNISVSLAVISVIPYSILGILSGEMILNMLLLLTIILTFSSINNFMKASSQLRSFKQIYNASPKSAVSLISDPAITLAMSKGIVEGDSLIAVPKTTGKIDDFMKYSTFGVFLGGKLPVLTIISLFLSILSGVFAATSFGSAFYGLYAASALLCISSLPNLFFIDVLPFYSSSKKLASVGAMISGKIGAEKIEEANALVLNSKDLFPSGTVTLHRMQVLSENNLEDTIVRAASLTENLQSPLSPIFKKIAGTGNITVFPNSDTVKYEENLGISGWVDDRLLFIGNRTLMEAHGISVPSVEVDRKILRQGFFPVYVASQNKACALLIIKYSVNPAISRELRRLTGIGVTLLIKNSDPNLTEEMICDYLGLYEDSVKVMTAAGCHIYNNTISPSQTCSAPGAYKSNPMGLPAIMNCANKIKRSNVLLTSVYIITAVFGVLLFAYTSFGGTGEMLSDTVLLIYSLITTTVSYLLYLIEKP